jgi:hypothetical protein
LYPPYIGVNRHQFLEVGNFHLSCEDDQDVSATIVVREAPLEDDASHLRPLLYTHAALMAAAFGFLLPLAAFLYYQGVTLGYKVLLPMAMAFALCGLVLIVVYVQLTTEEHIINSVIHSVVGIVLLALLLLMMPVLLLQRTLRKYHFKVGHVVAFFGMGNVLMVSNRVPGIRD